MLKLYCLKGDIMIDINLIRENKELVKENINPKNIFNLGSNYTFKNFTFEEDYNNIDTSNKFKSTIINFIKSFSLI